MGYHQEDRDGYIKTPVRVIMNNRTIGIFTGDNYKSNIKVFKLKKTKLVKDRNSKECFTFLEENGNFARVCTSGTEDPVKLLEEWDYDLNLFKFQCNYHKPDFITQDFQKKLANKIKDVKKSLLDEAQDNMRKNAEEKEDFKLQTHIKKVNKVALQAIQKELNLEELIKNEENLRGKREEERILKAIEVEKIKSVNIKFYLNLFMFF